MSSPGSISTRRRASSDSTLSGLARGKSCRLCNAGNDHLYGDVGRDRIRGGAGDDFIDGGLGDDVPTSGSGRGRIFAGPGNDHIDARLGRRTSIHCGDGIDTVQANRSTRIAPNCERVQSTGRTGTVRFL